MKAFLLAALWSAGGPGEVINLAAIDPASALQRHPVQPGRPLQFAEPRKTHVRAATHGTWTPLPEGRWRWQAVVRVPGATDLNLGFERFALPPDARIEVSAHPKYGVTRGYAGGRHGQSLWTALVPGDVATLTLEVAEREQADFVLSQVGAGFRDAFRTGGGLGLKSHGSCNNDVVCPEGDPWRDQVRATALYSINGSLACSGSLVNDVPESDRPFFLSAFHCGVNENNAASVVTYWNFQAPNCGDQDGGSLDESISGATLRALRKDVDVLLLELDDNPAERFGAFYSGWDRADIAPNGSVGIHHPRGHVKSISFNTDPLTSVPNCIVAGATESTHWEVDNWEDGTTEPGSSGSAIWDPDTRLLVGFLSGGLASCSKPNEFDCYGKFAVAWDGPDAASRLRDWLDPGGEAPLTLAGRGPELIFATSFELP